MESWDEETDLWPKYEGESPLRYTVLFIPAKTLITSNSPAKTKEMVAFLLAQVEPHGSMTKGWHVTHVKYPQRFSVR